MTPREFVALYIMYEHNIMHLDCSHPHLNWIINHFQMNCQALESMDVDCTEVHNAIKDVQDAADRLHRGALEKQLAFFTTQEEPEEEEVGDASLFHDNLKRYIHGLRLFLDKPSDESMDEFDERFRKAFSITMSTLDDPKQLPKQEEQEDLLIMT